jgi:protein disulfide-isomerase A1
VAKSFYALAKQYQDQINFVTVLTSDYPTRLEKLHLPKDSKRGFVIEAPNARAYPMLEDLFTVDNAAKHISAYLAGELSPVIKSEAVPTPSKSHPYLTRLVGSNFDDFIGDRSKDILIEFSIRDWCVYCTE